MGNNAKVLYSAITLPPEAFPRYIIEACVVLYHKICKEYQAQTKYDAP